MRRASCANWKSGIRTPDVQVSVCGAPDEGLDLRATQVLGATGALEDGRCPAHPAQDSRTDPRAWRRQPIRGQGYSAQPAGAAEYRRVTSRGGKAQTGLNRERIETFGIEVAKCLTGHLGFPDAHGAEHPVRSGEDECGDKRPSPTRENARRAQEALGPQVGRASGAARKRVVRALQVPSRTRFRICRPASGLTSQPHRPA